MFGNLPEWVNVLASLLLMGAAVKMLDDALDLQADLANGKSTIAGRLGRSVTAYVVILALCAAAFQLPVAIAVFLGSYAVGMFSSVRERMPTHMPAWLEILCACALAVLFCGWQAALWGVAMMAAVDWLDDLRDLPADRRVGERNLAGRIGFIETLLLVLVALSVAVLTEATWTVFAFLALAVLEVVAGVTTRQLWNTDKTDAEADA